MPHAASGDRGGAQYLLGDLGQLLEADEQDVGQAAGYTSGGRVRGRDQLLGVEGVALGAFDDPVHGGVRQRQVAQGAHQPRHVGVGQGPQFQPLHGGQPYQLGQQGPQRVAAVEVVRPVRGEHREPATGRPARRPLQDSPAEQEPQQVTGGLVGPVQVLQDQQQRGDVRQLGQQGGHALEQPQPRPRGGAPVTPVVRIAAEQPVGDRMRGQHGGEPLVGGQHSEDLGERQIRQAHVAQVDAVPGEDDRPGRGGPPGDLVQGPGLADPGVPGDQHGARLTGAGALQYAGETREFGLATDERTAERGLLHDAHPGTRLRQPRAGKGAGQRRPDHAIVAPQGRTPDGSARPSRRTRAPSPHRPAVHRGFDGRAPIGKPGAAPGAQRVDAHSEVMRAG